MIRGTRGSEVTSVSGRFRCLVSAYAVSSYGSYLNLIALSLFSYEVTGSALGIGALMALRLFAGMLAGLAAGALATRAGRRTLMISADIAQAVAMAVLALAAPHTSTALLACAVVVLGAGNTLFTVALRGAVPVMVGHEERVRANGLLVTVRSFATVLGFASAAPVIGFFGYSAAFAINGVSFLVSAAALLLLRPRTDGEEPDASAAARTDAGDGEEPDASAAARTDAGDGEEPDASAGARTDAGDGEEPDASAAARTDAGDGEEPDASAGARTDAIRAARGMRGLRGLSALLTGMILLRGADALASSSHNVALPVAAGAASPDDPALFMTQFWAAWAVGTLLAHQVLGRRADAGAAAGERAFAVGTCAMSLFFVLAFTGLPGPALVAVALGAGLADGCTEIIYTSRLQAVPDRQRSRLFGLSATAETSGFTLGTVAAAASLEALPALAVVGAFHGTAVLGALALLLFLAVRGGTASRRTRPTPGATQGGETTHGARTGTGSLPGA
ncbi:MFS transporter [Streptomyces sp. NPDC018833]|uniref:MFS transporter n=1 Tax=Streptomyces sp. NPDC018833 TaxID=3365053 RepID=UPI0037AEE208